jgi:zinc protease
MKYMFLSVLFMTAFSFVISTSWAKPSPEKSDKASVTPIAPFTKVTLKNGLDVLVKEVHSAPIVAVYLWCNTGSINETDSEQGISHFYEHMFFKGTEKRGVGEIDRAVKGLGGYNNAFTSKEYTAYYVVLPSENFHLAADVLIDAIRNSTFPEEEIQKELGVIKEEMNRKEDDPMGKMYEEMFKVMFPGTPYAHSVLGSPEIVSGITRDNFKSYLGKYYVPNNMTAVVVGDVKTADAIREIERLTEGWNPNPEIKKYLTNFEVPHLKSIQGFTLEKDVNMSYVMMAFQTNGLMDPLENASMDVASSILGEGKSSRLYKRIVEKEQIASAVNVFIYPLKRSGLFVILGTMDRENVPRFRDVVLEEIVKLRKNSSSQEELKKVKTMLKADFEFSNETDSDIANTLGDYNIQGIIERVTRYEETIDSVSPGDLNAYVKKILDPAAYSMGVINQRIPSNREVRGE